jgi:Cd2+/Zn2+-exporting ATPase
LAWQADRESGAFAFASRVVGTIIRRAMLGGRNDAGGRLMGASRCTLKVEGLDCPVEAGALRDALEGAPGLERIDFDLVYGTMSIHFRSEETSPSQLLRRVVARTRMKATLVDAEETHAPARLRGWLPTIGSGAALLAGVVLDWLSAGRGVVLAFYAIAIAVGGIDLFPKAVRAVIRRQLDIHVLMGLAVLGAIALGQWDEAATVAFLFGLSESLEALSLARASSAIRALLEVEPDVAERIAADGKVEVVGAGQVQPGERVRVRAGGRIPVDGTVVSGRSSVDQKAITGESLPILREPGDSVYAGTINGEGALEIAAVAVLGDALISRIIERVRAAQSDRTPIERTIGRFARVYTPMVVALAIAIAVVPPLVSLAIGTSPNWWGWLARSLVLLVVACPCALVIATPVAVASALASAARRGILIKGGSFLEEFGRLRVLAFDKTGTLTRGQPDVIDVVVAGENGGDDLLRIAAALGDQGGHVLGRAISRHARALLLEVPVAESYAAVPGLGASGTVDSVKYHIGSHRYIDEAGLCPPEFHARLDAADAEHGTSVALTGSAGPLGWIRLADRPRPEAARVLAELKELGISTIMLTGDNPTAAEAVGTEVGILELRSSLLPADKANLITALNAERGPTGMVGDGVNDAPALAAARVSVALGGISSPAAIETADVVLMADDLTNLPWLVRHSRATIRRIRQNIALALAIKAVVMILAVFDHATLGMAILADVGTTVLVTANALRLLRPKG